MVKKTEEGAGMGLVPIGEIKERMLEIFKEGREGFEEGTTPGELIIPRVKLLQGLSPEVQEEPKDFHAGMIIDSLTRGGLPETFIPIFKRTRWFRFNPRDAKSPHFVPEVKPGGIVWRSDDPNDPRVKAETQFGEHGEAPPATTFMEFLCYFEGLAMPVVLGFAKTSFKAGRELLSLARFSSGPMYGRKYKLRAVQESNDKGTFYVFRVLPAGLASPDEIEIGQALHAQLSKGGFQTHDESVEE